VVVRQRLARQIRIETFQPVQRIAVEQPAGVRQEIEFDSLHAEEASSCIDELRASKELRQDIPVR